MPQKTNNISKNLFLLFVVLIICFALLEAAVRLMWMDQRNDYPKEMFIKDETKGYELNPNFKGNFVMNAYKSVPIEINSKGLRDREFSYDKPGNTTRILLLGDSVTFGAGIGINETYEKLLEREFKENGTNLEIINAGISGYQLSQEVSYFFEEGFKYNSDIVAIGIVLNDIEEVNPLEAQKVWFGEENKNSLALFVRDNCRSCKFIYSLIHDMVQNREKYNQIYFEKEYSLWQGESFDSYRKKISALNKNLTSQNKSLLLIAFPYTQQFSSSRDYGSLPQQKLANLSKENNISFVDLLPFLDRKDYEKYYFSGDNVHPNAEGHKLIKDILYQEITKNNLIQWKISQ